LGCSEAFRSLVMAGSETRARVAKEPLSGEKFIINRFAWSSITDSHSCPSMSYSICDSLRAHTMAIGASLTKYCGHIGSERATGGHIQHMCNLGVIKLCRRKPEHSLSFSFSLCSCTGMRQGLLRNSVKLPGAFRSEGNYSRRPASHIKRRCNWRW